MPNILIGHGPNKQGKDQSSLSLTHKIKTLGNYWHCLDSIWIVKTAWSASQVRDLLVQVIDPNDDLLVVDITEAHATWHGFPGDCSSWLTRNL